MKRPREASGAGGGETVEQSVARLSSDPCPSLTSCWRYNIGSTIRRPDGLPSATFCELCLMVVSRQQWQRALFRQPS